MQHMNSHSQKVVQENRDYTMFSWSVQATANPMHMTRAQGVWFWDGDDNRWLDFSSQLINLNVGHQHPKMLEAIKKQVDELCFAGPGSPRSRAACSAKNSPASLDWLRHFLRWAAPKRTKTP